MLNYCIFKDKLTKIEDILESNFDSESNYICYCCENQLAINLETNMFYHTNIIDNDLECDFEPYESVKKTPNMFNNIIKNEYKDNLIKNDDTKYIIDGFITEHNMGIEFLNTGCKIDIEDVENLNALAEVDWILNVETSFIRKIEIGNFIICEVCNDNWEQVVKIIDNNVFLYTGTNNWIWLVDRISYKIEIGGEIKKVWIGELCSLEDVLDNTCLQYIIDKELLDDLLVYNDCNIETNKIIYARCEKSMYLLDDIHRQYISNYAFKNNEIIAIKSVAGSGKTTTLLNIAKSNPSKRILYIAFNKNLIGEIKDKLRTNRVPNVQPYTFDALLYKLFIFLNDHSPEITDLKPQNVGKLIPFLNDKPYKVKYYYCKRFSNFCSNAEHNNVKEYCETMFGEQKPLLEKMWNEANAGKFVTFETIRKRAYINHWFKNFIDKAFDLVMVDETQDFDLIMLNMLLNDTTIPKVFVGDNKQSIYQFRGCINAFNYLPKDALIMEFYSTFRVGNPACNIISNKFTDCFMISKSKSETKFVSYFDNNEKYVYLFRSWRILLQTAEVMRNIWISGFDKKINDIRNLHNKLQFKNNTIEDEEYEDDLPKFLKTLTKEQLDKLLNNITNNLVTFANSRIQMYTVHSYKGMENDNIRMAGDINIKDDENIYYVAITRGMKKIMIDG
jgi:hypothetical protein